LCAVCSAGVACRCAANQTPVKHIRIEKTPDEQYSLVNGTTFPDIIVSVVNNCWLELYPPPSRYDPSFQKENNAVCP